LAERSAGPWQNTYRIPSYWCSLPRII